MIQIYLIKHTNTSISQVTLIRVEKLSNEHSSTGIRHCLITSMWDIQILTLSIVLYKKKMIGKLDEDALTQIKSKQI